MARSEAIGLIETFGIVYAIEAADAMCKAADVELIGFENTASGYISVLTEGDVGACRTAVAAGCKAVRNRFRSIQFSSYRKTSLRSRKDHCSVFFRQAPSLRRKIMIREERESHEHKNNV